MRRVRAAASGLAASSARRAASPEETRREEADHVGRRSACGGRATVVFCRRRPMEGADPGQAANPFPAFYSAMTRACCDAAWIAEFRASFC